MPVSRLLVEGKLDRELLGPLLGGSPVLDPHNTPKGSLAPRTRDLRRDTSQIACYLRDRDFDFLPPLDLSQPTIDTVDFYKLTVKNGMYEYDGKLRPFDHETKTLKIKQPDGLMKEEQLEVRRSIQGPVVYDSKGVTVATVQ